MAVEEGLHFSVRFHNVEQAVDVQQVTVAVTQRVMDVLGAEAVRTGSLEEYDGPINQWGIGLHVEGHAAFIGAVYDRVITHANNA